MRDWCRRPGFFFLLALLLRLPALLWHVRWNPDSLAYLYLGGGLWRGHFPPLPMSFLASPPGCALVLGWISFLPTAWQDSAGYLLQTIISAALVFPLYALTRRRFGARAAMWAALLAAFAHPFILTAAQFQAEAVYLLALFGGIALLERRYRLALLAAPMFALATLTRGEGPAVVAGVLVFAAMRAKANHRPYAFTRVLICAGVCSLAVGVYALSFNLMSGQLPWGFYFRNAAGVGALSGKGGALDVAALTTLRAQPWKSFIDEIIHRLPATLARNAWWWLAGMLPGALFVLLPALPLALWRRLRALCLTRLRGLDPLDGVVLATTLIFLVVWRARHHAPMGLAPLIPILAATIARVIRYAPKIFTVLFSLWIIWASGHAALRYQEYARLSPLPGVTLARRLAAKEIISDDLPALDESSREDWLGSRNLPLLPPNTTEVDWRSLADKFPSARIAIHNDGLPVAPPPAAWRKLDCQPGLNDLKSPVCAYEIPAR